MLERLADVGHGDRPVDVDQLALLAHHIEELAEVVKGHCALQALRHYRLPIEQAQIAVRESPCPGRSAARSDALQTRDPGFLIVAKKQPGSRISGAPFR